MIKDSVIAWLAALGLVVGYALLTRPGPAPSAAKAALDGGRVSVSIHEKGVREAMAALGLAAGVEIRIPGEVNLDGCGAVSMDLRDVPLRAALGCAIGQSLGEKFEAALSEDQKLIVIGPPTPVARVYEVGALVSDEAGFHGRWIAAGGDESDETGANAAGTMLFGTGVTPTPLAPASTPGMACNLEGALAETVVPYAWTLVGGSDGAMRVFGRRMVVIHDAHAHEKMRAALGKLLDATGEETR